MSYPSTSFILSAIDPDFLYPCLEVRFETDDLDALRRLVDPDAPEDADLDDYYLLSPTQVAAVCEAFAIAFDHGSRDGVISKYADTGIRIPYLIHTGYELALMVQGRKPFGFIEFNSAWRPSVVLKARFDEYVARGVLHAHEILFDAPASIVCTSSVAAAWQSKWRGSTSGIKLIGEPPESRWIAFIENPGRRTAKARCRRS